MAVKGTIKTNREDLPSLAQPGIKNTGELLKAALFKIDIKGRVLGDPQGIFHLNPSAFSESKSANWVQTAIPGQSDPVMQWVSSGARTITFDALVTADTSDFNVEVTKKATEAAKPKSVVEVVSSYAVKLFKVQIPPKRGELVEKDSDILNISKTLDYYRSLLYPTYSDPSGKGVPQRLKASPPLLVLIAGSGIAKLAYSSRITNKHDLWVLTDLRINITKQRPNLDPMEANVSFTLVQYNIRSFDSGRFHTNSGFGD